MLPVTVMLRDDVHDRLEQRLQELDGQPTLEIWLAGLLETESLTPRSELERKLERVQAIAQDWAQRHNPGGMKAFGIALLDALTSDVSESQVRE